VPDQLILPFEVRSALGREDFLVAPGNAQAVAFIDRWPDWRVSAAALHGPSGSGKSHLVQIWQGAADAVVVEAAALSPEALAALPPDRPLAIENVDGAAPSPARDNALFALLNQSNRRLLLTGHTAPITWPVSLLDLASRLAALPDFALWTPDDGLLAGIARKLFTDRQLDVPDTVIMRMVQSLERSPAAIRDFVARADAAALARHRPINTALIRELLTNEASSS
jgi:chromosomal replication initiation ATPase DnaA